MHREGASLPPVLSLPWLSKLVAKATNTCPVAPCTVGTRTFRRLRLDDGAMIRIDARTRG